MHQQALLVPHIQATFLEASYVMSKNSPPFPFSFSFSTRVTHNDWKSQFLPTTHVYSWKNKIPHFLSFYQYPSYSEDLRTFLCFLYFEFISRIWMNNLHFIYRKFKLLHFGLLYIDIFLKTSKSLNIEESNFSWKNTI